MLNFKLLMKKSKSKYFLHRLLCSKYMNFIHALLRITKYNKQMAAQVKEWSS